MKTRHAVALALIVALGYLVLRGTLHPWYIMEAPQRTCVGPNDPDYDHHRLKCFDLQAPLSKWTKVKTPWLRTGWRIYRPEISNRPLIVTLSIIAWRSITSARIYYPRADFKSYEDCSNHLWVMIAGRLQWHAIDVEVDPRLPLWFMCIAADDPRLAKNKGPYEQ